MYFAKIRGLLITTAIVMPFVLPTNVAALEPGVLIWGDNMSPGADPHTVYDTPIWFITNNLYDNLYRYQGNPPEMVPWLAESHEASNDGLTWTFKLREGIKFHDGSIMTADDVVYTFQRVLGIGKGPAGAFLPILKPENITAVNDLTVKFVLDEPYAPFLSAIPMVPIVNSKLVKQHVTADDQWATAWLGANEAGSGAYALTPGSYESMVRFDYDRFPDHFMGWSHNPKPIDKVKARYIQESSTRANALIRGDIDASSAEHTAEEVARMEAAAPSVVVRKDPVMRLFLITMNNQKPPLDNVNVRKCFSYAFNYDGFINDVLKGLARRSRAPIPDNLFGYPEGIVGYDYDLAKAKQYCDMARSEGADLTTSLNFHYQSDGDQTRQAAQMFQSDLATLGVNINLVPDVFAHMAASAANPDTTPDMWIHWVSPYFIDPENWIGQMYDSKNAGAWKASSRYSNPEVDALLTEAREISDRDRRAELYAKAAEIVVEDAAEIYIYDTIVTRGLSSRVKNYTFSPIGYGGEVRFMSLEE